MIIFVIVIDVFLYGHWNKSKLSSSRAGKILAALFFVVMPILSFVIITVFSIWLPETKSPVIYRVFGWTLIFFIGLYLFKLIYSVFYGAVLLLDDSSKERIVKKHYYPRITRRKFVSQIGIIMATAPFVSLMFGAFRGRFAFYTRHVRLSFPNLPDGFEGFRFVHISDLHLGSFGVNSKPIEEIVELVNSENPELILFTGDMVNNFAGEMNGWISTLSKLKAPMGKYSILGNHDYGFYSRWDSANDFKKNFTDILKGQEKMGFKILRNESVVLQRKGDQIGLAGVENWGSHSYPQNGDLTKAAEGLKEQQFNLLMSHDPDHWDKQVLDFGHFDLTLSGHTHGMQFGIEKGNIKWSPAQYVQKRWAGLYREKDMFLYVNRGLGYHGIPARVGMPPEITVVELRRGALDSETV